MGDVGGDKIALVGIGHLGASDDRIDDHPAAIEFSQPFLRMQPHEYRITGQRYEVTDTNDGLHRLYLSGSVFAYVFRHNLGGNQAVRKRCRDSTGGSGPGWALIGNYRPLGALDEDADLIPRVIRG